MSLDKAIEHGKEFREEYRGSKAIDRTCRNHGSCDWCKNNRTIQHNKIDIATKQRFNEFISGADMRGEETDCDYERAVDQLEHDILYEPTFNQDDGSM